MTCMGATLPWPGVAIADWRLLSRLLDKADTNPPGSVGGSVALCVADPTPMFRCHCVVKLELARVAQGLNSLDERAALAPLAVLRAA